MTSKRPHDASQSHETQESAVTIEAIQTRDLTVHTQPCPQCFDNKLYNAENLLQHALSMHKSLLTFSGCDYRWCLRSRCSWPGGLGHSMLHSLWSSSQQSDEVPGDHDKFYRCDICEIAILDQFESLVADHIHSFGHKLSTALVLLTTPRNKLVTQRSSKPACK